MSAIEFDSTPDPAGMGRIRVDGRYYGLPSSAVAQLAAERAQRVAADETSVSLLALIADIRAAAGDNGKLMQDELVEHVRALARGAERYRFLREQEYWSVRDHENRPLSHTTMLLQFMRILDADKMDAAIDAAQKEGTNK